MNSAEDLDYRKIKLVGEEVQGKALLTSFYGMDMTRDKLSSLIRKWQTLIEASVDVKTTDGYVLRMFSIAFTKRRPNQVRKTSYAQSSQIRAIRKKMQEIMSAGAVLVRYGWRQCPRSRPRLVSRAEATKSDLKGLVNKFIPEAIAKEIEKACNGIYPLQNVFIRKVKLLKAPRFDIVRLMDMHGDSGSPDDAGRAVKEADAPLVAELDGAGGRL